jgi:hypothetical protein
MEFSQALPDHYLVSDTKEPTTIVRPNEELLTKVSPKHSLITKSKSSSSSPASSPKRPSSSPVVRLDIDSEEEEEEDKNVAVEKDGFKVMAAIDSGKVYWMFHIRDDRGGQGFKLLFDPASVYNPSEIAIRVQNNKDGVWCDLAELTHNPEYKSLLFNIKKAGITGSWTAYPEVDHLAFDDPKRPIVRISCHIDITTSLY